jgi:hypothetical protein
MTNLFMDLDGVLAAFDENVERRFGAPPSVLGDERMWQLVNNHEDFWIAMPLKEGAAELWAAALPFKPVVLTGCPRSNYEQAAAHKREWVAGHFGSDIKVITCLSRDKQLHLIEPGDVLVDDRVQNIKRWRKVGGVGVLYHNHEQAIREMLAAMAA